MAFLEKLHSFGVSETVIKGLFAQHLGHKLSSDDEVEILGDLPDSREEVDNYASDIKSISVLINANSTKNDGAKKDANFIVKTSLGSFATKVLV